MLRLLTVYLIVWAAARWQWTTNNYALCVVTFLIVWFVGETQSLLGLIFRKYLSHQRS